MTAASRTAVAASTLRNAEQGVASGKNSDSNSRSGSLYTGTGRDTKSGEKGSLKGKLKSKIALIVLVSVLGGGAAFLGASHSLLAPAIQILSTEATDTQSLSMRAVRIFKYALKGEGDSWDGGKAYSEVPDAFETRLNQNDIEIEGRTLVYTDVDANGTTTVKNIDADNVVDVYKSDVDFRDSYTSARRGRIVNFFDKAATAVYKFLGIPRNDYVDYRQTDNPDVDNANYKENLSSRFEGDSTSVTRTTIEEQTQYNEDGSVMTDGDGNEIKRPGATTDQGSGKVSTDAAAAETSARSIINAMASKVSNAVNVGCGALAIGSMISTLIAVNEIYQSIDYFLNNSENLSKMMAGFGSESAINPFLNFITANAFTNVADFSDGNVTVTGGTVDNGDLVFGFADDGKGVDLSGSFVEGNTAQMVLANAPGSRQTTNLFSFERTGNSIARLLGVLTAGAASYKTCAIAKIGVNALSIAVTLSPAGILSVTSNIVFKCLKGVLVSITASLMFAFLIPILADVLKNPVTYLVGEAASAEFFRGADAASSMLAQSGSAQAPLSREKAAAYNRLAEEYLALDAEIDRKNHSPFDITNKNTFFGNIAYRFILPLTTSSSLATNTSAILRTTSTSIASLISPNTYAASASSYTYPSYIAPEGDCGHLDEFQIAGKIFCLPHRGSDLTTVDLSPDDPTYKSIIDPNLDCDDKGNCTVIPNSELDFFQQDCTDRKSPIGIEDQNIINRHVLSGKISMISEKLGTVLSGLPLIGDLMDGVDGIQTALDDRTLMWGNGLICSNTPENPYWDGEMKYYAQYIEDMRIIDQMHSKGDSTTSNQNQNSENDEDSEEEQVVWINPILANQERYEAENPITSYAGYLSRISGITLENIEIILAMVDYYNYIEDYNPDARVALTEHELTTTSSAEVIANLEHEDIRFKDPSIPKFIDKRQIFIVKQQKFIVKRYDNAIAADLRNRSYAA